MRTRLERAQLCSIDEPGNFTELSLESLNRRDGGPARAGLEGPESTAALAERARYDAGKRGATIQSEQEPNLHVGEDKTCCKNPPFFFQEYKR